MNTERKGTYMKVKRGGLRSANEAIVLVNGSQL